MTNYIYMSTDMFCGLICNRHKKVFLKVGFSKHPHYRGLQLRYEGRVRYNLDIPRHTTVDLFVPINSMDRTLTAYIEKYVLRKATLMKSANPCKGSKEYLRMSIADRERCHAKLVEWVAEAITAYNTTQGA